MASHRQRVTQQEEDRRLATLALVRTQKEQDRRNSLDNFECYQEGYKLGFEDGRDNYVGSLGNPENGSGYSYPDAYLGGYRDGWTAGNDSNVNREE